MRRAANPWDRFYRYQVAPWRGEAELSWLPDLGGLRVLELGCGNGKTLRAVRRTAADVVGLDISWHALRRLGEGVLADVRRLPVASEAFDAVLDLHCTGHLASAERVDALSGALRCVRPGGLLALERLGPADVRASGGAPHPDEADMRVLEDGRATAFLAEGQAAGEAEQAGWVVEQAATVSAEVRWHGRRTTRQRVRVIARRPG